MMKTYVALVLALMAILIPVALHAQQACSDSAQFKNFDTAYLKSKRLSEIQKRINNPTAYPELLKDGRYELCITMAPFPVDAISGEAAIVINGNAQRDYHIVGLNLVENGAFDKPLVIVRNNSAKSVQVNDLTVDAVKNGLTLQGTGLITISSSTITGDVNYSGTCLEIASKGAIVQSTDISHCAEGIVIDGADDVLIGAANKDHVTTDMNVIHDNVIGLHVLSGQRNKFAYNLIYDNKPPAGEADAQNTITIESGANEDLAPPAVNLIAGDDGNQYALRCTWDSSGNVLTRQMTFQAPQQGGSVALYEVKDHNQDAKPQMYQYITTCELNTEGVCSIANLPDDVMAMIHAGDCGIKAYYITVLFTGTSSTELPASVYEMTGPVGKPSDIVSVPVDMPGPTSGATSSSGDTGTLGSGGDSAGSALGSGIGGAGSGATCALTPNAPQAASAVDLIALVAGLVGLLLLKQRLSVVRQAT